MPHAIALALTLLTATCHLAWSAELVRRLPVADYVDRMAGGWLGQIAGVARGGPTEFRWYGAIIPEADMPAWDEELVNHAFGQDDLYVEMTFLRTLEVHGLDVSPRVAGIDFANSEYGLACANKAGRENLRRGISPPDSGHPHFSRNSDDIDYQIEADYSGLIAPGMPDLVVDLGERFGRIMNYGDGLYAGQFMGGMYAEAFFTEDLEQIVRAGLACIPAESQYAEMVRDVLTWHAQEPDEWERTWRLATDRFYHDPDYHRYAGPGIDAKINGAYVLIGLLHGNGDPDRTIELSCRCGLDSDCNPSSAAGVLFTTIGRAGLPSRFKDKLNQEAVFSHTAYSYPALLTACEKLARQAVLRQGGAIRTDARGQEVFVIPVREPRVGAVERSWDPGPIAGSMFTARERALIRFQDELSLALEAAAPGWSLADCGPDMGAPGFLAEFRGRDRVLIIHPLDRETGCVLAKTVSLPANRRSELRLTVGHHEHGDWLLVVRADEKVIREQVVGPQSAAEGWLDVAVDLSAYAGQEVLLELVNQPTGWAWEASYWDSVAVVTE